MKYDKKAVKAYIENDIKKLEEYTKRKEPVIMVLGHIQNGHFYDHACRLAGISERIFRYWKKRKLPFLRAVELADARAIEKAKHKIEELADAKQDWKGWAFLLSVKDKRYKEKTDIPVTITPMVVLDINDQRPDKNKIAPRSNQTPPVSS